MEKSSIQNSNGKILNNRYLTHIVSFISPKIVWPVYGYWITLILLPVYQKGGENYSFIGLPERWISFLEYFNPKGVPVEVHILNIVFFYLIIFIIVINILKDRLDLVLYYVIHFILILWLYMYVFGMLVLCLGYGCHIKIM